MRRECTVASHNCEGHAVSLTAQSPPTTSEELPISVGDTDYMSVEPENREVLPVACTLGQVDGARRLADWRRITADAGAGHAVTPGMLTLRFRDAPGIGAELKRLVTAERECCGFLGWNVARVDDEWQVNVSGSDAELRSLPLTV